MFDSIRPLMFRASQGGALSGLGDEGFVHVDNLLLLMAG